MKSLRQDSRGKSLALRAHFTRRWSSDSCASQVQPCTQNRLYQPRAHCREAKTVPGAAPVTRLFGGSVQEDLDRRTGMRKIDSQQRQRTPHRNYPNGGQDTELRNRLLRSYRDTAISPLLHYVTGFSVIKSRLCHLDNQQVLRALPATMRVARDEHLGREVKP